jgi:hypothetical protein
VRKRAAPTPATLARALETDVKELMVRSEIGRDPARVLLAILGRIDADMERGESAPVCNGLRNFAKMVQQFMNQGALAQSDGQSLMNGSDNLRLMLGCPDREKVLGQ